MALDNDRGRGEGSNWHWAYRNNELPTLYVVDKQNISNMYSTWVAVRLIIKYQAAIKTGSKNYTYFKKFNKNKF